jgi:hypothetical protein
MTLKKDDCKKSTSDTQIIDIHSADETPTKDENGNRIVFPG